MSQMLSLDCSITAVLLPTRDYGNAGGWSTAYPCAKEQLHAADIL